MSKTLQSMGFEPEEAPFAFDAKPVQQAIQEMAVVVPVLSTDPLTRMERCRRAVEAMGIDWPATIVPEGSALIDIGVQKLKRDRAKWDAMPDANQALAVVGDALAAEARKDFSEEVGGLRMRKVDGRLVRVSNIDSDPRQVPGMAYTDHALRQLLGRAGVLDEAPRGFANAMAYVSNEERAQVFNRLVKEKAAPGKMAVLRTKAPHGGSARVVRAVLSEKYGDASDTHIAEILSGIGLPEGAKLGYFPGDDSRFEVVFPNRLEIPQVKAGDLHKVGVYARNNDVGSGGFESYAGITRILCVNLTLADRHGEVDSVRHVGRSASVIAKIRTAMQVAMKDIEPLIETIGYSAGVVVVESMADVMAKVAARFGEGKGAAETWAGVWKEKQYPATVWGLTAAITEAAHQRDGWSAEEDWERVGSWVTDGAVKAVKAGYDWSEVLKEGGRISLDAQLRASLAQRQAQRGN